MTQAHVSFGKDSLAMLLMLIADRVPLDEVVFFDTGMEFDAIYKMRDKILPILKENNIKYTELKPSKPFIEYMLGHKHYTRKGELKIGYGWCGGRCRWGTTEKIRALTKHAKDADIVYVGIAKDEPERLARLKGTNKVSYLDKKGFTEKMALELCKECGFDWDGLYDILDRVSCWCCRNKNLKELANYKKHLPNYFKSLVSLEEAIGEPMKGNKFLQERFPE